MTMLGAQLDDLATLADQLRRTAADLGATRDGSTSLSQTMVSSTQDAAQTGLSQINEQLAAMSSSVSTSVNQANASQWTGANADRFRDGAAGFQQNIEAGRATTEQAFNDFNTHINALASSLEAYVQSFGAALSGAEESSNQMSGAVEAQRANLDQVMNTGMAFS